MHETPQDDTTELKKKSEEYDQLKSDYEDLLVLLEDQDAKILSLKVTLLVKLTYHIAFLVAVEVVLPHYWYVKT